MALAFAAGKEALPDYPHRFAPKVFTQPQLFACLALKTFFNLSLFTAETACGPSAGPDLCFVQATIDGVPMDPDGLAFQAIQSEDGSAEGNAYEWIERVGEGQHVIAIERRVQNAATPFYTDDWTFDVEVHN